MLGRRYFYHLKFELYDNPTPKLGRDERKKNKQTHRTAHKDIYLPSPETDIFLSTLPAHTRTVPGGKSNLKKKTAAAGSTAKLQPETNPHPGPGIIDLGPLRNEDGARDVTGTSEKDEEVWTRTGEHAAATAVRDWRFGPVRIESVDMGPLRDRASSSANIAGSSQTTINGAAIQHPVVRGSINAGPRSNTTKARFEPLHTGLATATGPKTTDVGWGIVHLYRDGEETPDPAPPAPGHKDEMGEESKGEVEGEADTTILCIPAVPSYMTPNDFLGWVGERTREEVSNFRMVMTGRMNRYLVLMKFREAEAARRWRAEWDGKVFGGLEPENCHVMFIKSIVFQTPSGQGTDSFPNTNHDPFTPNLGGASSAASLALKPFPPPTPSLVELPTCPVCLERMDDTTSLLTILCQHVFHCACLSKWRGSGCPVCRHTQPHPSLTQPFGTSASDLCRVCDCPDDLWICLICGHVGCGRYKGGHAKEHWKESAHNYALEIETQHVWDYAGDLWVHRWIQTKGDGKLVELPSNSRPSHGFGGLREDEIQDGAVDMVPRVKLENIGLEYTHLLTSQLESQRIYYEDIVKKTVAKASSASKSASAAAAEASDALAALQKLTLEHARLRDETLPEIERERDRAALKVEKATQVAKAMTKSWQEEKQVGAGLMERIRHINEGMASLSTELTKAKEECAELREQNRDLGFFISGQEKLKEVGEGMGTGGGEEVVSGTVSLPPPPTEREEGKDGKGRGKGGKGKGRGK